MAEFPEPDGIKESESQSTMLWCCLEQGWTALHTHDENVKETVYK